MSLGPDGEYDMALSMTIYANNSGVGVSKCLLCRPVKQSLQTYGTKSYKRIKDGGYYTLV
jgi:hypothetical protein